MFPKVQKRNKRTSLSQLAVTVWSLPITTVIRCLLEKCDAVDIGAVGIFVVNGDVYIKELGNKCLISHNEKYKPIRIGENDSVYCCGRVIGIV